jgi:hypothetical protein
VLEPSLAVGEEVQKLTVVADRLVGCEDEGVALACVDVDRVHKVGLVSYTVGLNDVHGVPINLEDEMRVA